MSEQTTVTVRVPKELIKQLDEKVGARYRSEYIRQAIVERLKQGSKTTQVEIQVSEINELKARISALELALKDLGSKSIEIQIPALLEVIALDDTDRQIISYILEKKNATTKELEKVVNLKRRMILERTKTIERRYEEKFGKPFLRFVRGKKEGKRQSWWIIE
jgi:metal-responsive CopG/Arc/MetJ family transcriptional regulator